MPGRQFTTGGWRETGRTRLRSTWCGLVVYEVEREHHDGTRQWTKPWRGTVFHSVTERR